MKNNLLIKVLQALYIIVFIFSISLITVIHLIPAPAFAVFRIPTQLREIGPILGLTWPTSLEVYHAFLLMFFTIIILNGIGLYRISKPKWQSICRVSSFLGLFLAWSVFLFFLVPLFLNGDFGRINLQTSFIYSMFAFGFFIVNLLTFTIAEEKRK